MSLRVGPKGAPAGRRIPPTGALSLQQVDHTIGQTLFAEHDVQLAGRGDLFENLQFPQPHQCRAAFEQLDHRANPVECLPGEMAR